MPADPSARPAAATQLQDLWLRLLLSPVLASLCQSSAAFWITAATVPLATGAFIEALSDTYRYMLASRNGRLVSLADELRALEHHHLLAATRYGGLTRTEICVDPVLASHLYLPPVSLGELFQNALKHNDVTRTHPLVLQVTLQEDLLIIANALRPRARPSPSIGMGCATSPSGYGCVLDGR